MVSEDTGADLKISLKLNSSQSQHKIIIKIYCHNKS